MSRIITGHLDPDGAIIYVPVGFVPNFLFAMEYGASNPVLYYWFGSEEEDSESTDGVSGSTGTPAKLTAAAGFTGYDTGNLGPYGIVGDAAVILDWAASDAYAARSATAGHGSYCRATATGTDDNGLVVDRSAIFECIVAGTSGSTEPTWPSNIGGQVLDSTPVWEKVTDVATGVIGYKGFTIAAALMTDGQEWYYMAVRSDDTVDHGDSEAWPGGIKGM